MKKHRLALDFLSCSYVVYRSSRRLASTYNTAASHAAYRLSHFICRTPCNLLVNNGKTFPTGYRQPHLSAASRASACPYNPRRWESVYSDAFCANAANQTGVRGTRQQGTYALVHSMNAENKCSPMGDQWRKTSTSKYSMYYINGLTLKGSPRQILATI